MAEDARSVQLGVDFDTSSAIDALDEVDVALKGLDDVATALESGVAGLDKALENAGEGGTEALSWIRDAADMAGKKISGMDDAIGVATRRVAMDAETAGEAFRKSWGLALKHGQSLTKSLGTGFKGFFTKVKKDISDWHKNFTTKVKAVGEAFKHPIKTIKKGLSDALLGVTHPIKSVTEFFGKLGKKAKETGENGSKAMDKMKGAVSGAMKAFLSVEAIKKAGQAVANFAKAAIGAVKDGEQSAAKFNAMFKDKASEDWAASYSKSIGRATSDVKGFMVANKGMFDSMGMTEEETKQLSKVTTSLALDFANAFNMEDADAMGLMQDAIKGNADALSEYGVKLDDATLKAKAKSMGIHKDLKDVDDATMAQVRLNTIMDQTADVQKKAGDSGGGLTNSLKSIKGMAKGFLEDAGAKLAPMLLKLMAVFTDAWPTLEPSLMQLVTVLSDGLSQSMPVLAEIGSQLLPVLASVLGTVLTAAMPLLPVIADLAKTVLPPLASIIKLVAETAMPPLVGILDAVLPILGTLIEALSPIISALLPPLYSLLEAITPILNALSPILKLIGQLLVPIAEVVGKIIGWVADKAGKVTDFFGSIFGGSKKSKEAVEDMGSSFSDIKLDPIQIPPPKPVETPPVPAPDTTKYSAGISTAAAAAGKTVQKGVTETTAITAQSLDDLGGSAMKTYASIAEQSERSWAAAVEAAKVGTGKIIGFIGQVNGLGTVSVSVSNPIPHHARGTENFPGGETYVNEEGGEIAVLPSGSKIIPADKSERIADGIAEGAGQKVVKKEVTITLNVVVTGGGLDPEAERRLAQQVAETVLQKIREDRAEDEVLEIIQNGYVA
ncbi:MAG: hypothetical protein LBJ11_09120 [Oscillospiraceae bacterium]|jgi:phage-related protein|nr:hypothetical protein [Oscillospiraceae bacterium]